MQPAENTTTAADKLDTLQGAVELKLFSMSAGDPVEVFWGNVFWKACITQVDGRGFHFVYDNSEHERGYRLKSSLHFQWRFAEAQDSKHYTTENMLALRQIKRRRTAAT